MRRSVKTALPDGEFGFEAAGEAAFDELHGALEGNFDGGEEQVDVVRHDDEGVELVVAFAEVMLEGFEEGVGVGFDLEEAPAIVGLGADEESAVAGCSGGDGHGVGQTYLSG
jgi:hypothetical protein